MIQLLLDNPLLLLFIVTAIGYPLGHIKIKGSSLGVAAVLFVGLAFGSLHPDLKLPEVIYTFGLVLFVYTIGLSSGPAFFASFRRKGLRDNLLIVGGLCLAAGLTVATFFTLDLKSTLAAGLFTGSMTNTPALAALLEQIKGFAPANLVDEIVSEPVVGYSIAYPIGVIGPIMAIFILQRLWRIDYTREAKASPDLGATNQQLQSRTIRITRPEATQLPVHDLIQQQQWNVIFGRIKQGDGPLTLASGSTRLAAGDLLTMIGTQEDLDEVANYLGELSTERLELDRTEYDFRRMFVSNPRVIGHRLRDLDLPQQFGAIVTRLRRGDVELLVNGDTVLEPGDRVRVLAKPEAMAAVSKFFGDSYRALSEIDLLTFSLGVTLGLLLGSIPIPLPGGVTFKLGLAGGPLIVGLILGNQGRTGPMVWAMPYSANLVLRQIGLILFLAAVGTRSGYAFVNTFAQSGGIYIFLAGAAITCVTAVAVLCVGHYLLNIPMGLLTGLLSGMQTQPAVLGFALEQSENDLPNIGYATVYPIATIAKILLAQLILTIFR
ncbi:MAG: transporter [Anaerolineales bacterium]|nr:transporter [Anaerolineales bacterium]